MTPIEVPAKSILGRAKPDPKARFVMVHGGPDFTTNVPLEDLNRAGNLLATHFGDEPLAAEHGGPVQGCPRMWYPFCSQKPGSSS